MLSFWSIPIWPGIGNSKKIEKKCKKINNIIMGSFQTKMGRDRLRMAERKKLSLWRTIHSNLFQNWGFQKNSKKFQKIKEHHYGFFSSQNGTGQAQNERKKNYRFDSFQPDPELGIKKKTTKKWKKLKKLQKSMWLLLKPKQDGRGWEWERKENSHPEPFQSDPEEGIPKK